MSIWQIILYFIGELYCSASFMYVNSKLSEKKLSIKYSMLYILILTILLLVNNFFNINQFKIIMSFCIIFISNLIFFKKEAKEILISTVISTLVIVVFELLFAPIFLHNYTSIEKLNINGPLLKTIYTFFVFTISNIFFSIKKIEHCLKKFKDIIKKAISVEVLLVIILIIFNILGYFLIGKMNNIHFIISLLVSIGYIITTVIMITINKKNIQKLKLKNLFLEKSYSSYSNILDEFREYKHNLKNKLFAIKCYLPESEQNKLNEIIINYNDKCEWLKDIKNMPQGLEGLLYLKKYEAENKKVDLIINYNSKMKIKNKDYLDLCDVLGIFLDNAIESSFGKEKVVLLEAYDKKNSIIIKITNKFNNYINLSKIGEKNYSTKKVKSGIGLNYVNNLKNKCITTDIKIINNLFNAYIIYKK